MEPILSRLLQQQTELLQTLAPPIEAFGVGGSVSGKMYDENSDLDFFVLLPNDNFFKHLAYVRSQLIQVTHVAALPEIDFVPHFGFKVSLVLHSKTSLQFFINSPDTLTADAMRLKTTILYDGTGFFTCFIANLRKDEDYLKRQMFISLSHDYLNELLKIKKFLRRRDMLQFHYSMRVLWGILLTLDRYTVLGQLSSPHDAERNVARDLGQTYESTIVGNSICLTPHSAHAILSEIRSRVLAHLHAGHLYYSLDVAYYDIERELASDIEDLCS